MGKLEKPVDEIIDPRGFTRTHFRYVEEGYYKMQYIDPSKLSTTKVEVDEKDQDERSSRAHDEPEDPINWRQLTELQSKALEDTCVSIIVKPENNWLIPFLEALLHPEEAVRSEKDKELVQKTSNLSDAEQERKEALEQGFIDANTYILRKPQWTSAKKILESWSLAEMRCGWGKMVKLTTKGRSIVEKALKKIEKRTQKEKAEQHRKELIVIARRAVRKVFKDLKETNQEVLKNVTETLVDRMEAREGLTAEDIVADYSELIRSTLDEQKPPSTDDEPSMEVDPFNGSSRPKKRKK